MEVSQMANHNVVMRYAIKIHQVYTVNHLKIGGHHASFNATPPILGKFAKKHHFWNICSLSDTLNLNPHE